jgi:hypothetical protein
MTNKGIYRLMKEGEKTTMGLYWKALNKVLMDVSCKIWALIIWNLIITIYLIWS